METSCAFPPPRRAPRNSPPAGSNTAVTNSWRDLWICVALLIATFAAYAQVRNFDFLKYDDAEFVTNNIHLYNGLTPQAIAWAFKSTYAANWCPLTWCSYALGYQFYGLNPGWHHLTNVSLHVISVLLLYLILRAATGAVWRSAFVAFLFALHPAHVEPVAWIAERKEVLGGLFWFLTIGVYLLYVRRPRTRLYLLLLLAFSCGLMSKPMIVTLPFALLLLDIWPLMRIKRTSVRHLIFEKLPLFALSAAASVFTFVAQKRGGAVSSLGLIPLGLRIQNALISCASYVFEFLWPAKLAAVYPFPSKLPVRQVAGASLLLVVITLLALREFRRRPYIAVGWFWFVGTLIPVIGLVQVGVQSRADRYTYVPFVGLSILLAWGANEMFSPFKWGAPALALVSVAACLACFVMTLTGLSYWRNGVALFEHALDVTSNNWVAQNGLSQALLADGRVSDAIPHLQESIRLQPNAPESHVIFGDALNKSDNLNAAEVQFRIALRLQPDNPDAQEALGMILTEKGQMQEALPHLVDAIHLRPDDPDSHYNLGRLYGLSGQTKQAVTEFAEVVRLNPDDIAAHYNLGTALAMEGRLEDACDQFRFAIRLKPDYLKAHLALGSILAQLNRCDEAISELRKVLQMEPDSEEARNLLQGCSTQRRER